MRLEWTHLVYSGVPAAAMNPPFLSHSSYHDGKMKSKKRSHKEKYRLKCLRLRRLAKTMVFENAALCDEIARIESKFVQAKEERRFLLKRFLQLQALGEDDRPPTHSSSLSLSFDMPSMSDGNLDMSLPSVADNGLGKKLKKDKREKGKENKLEVIKKLTKKEESDRRRPTQVGSAYSPGPVWTASLPHCYRRSDSLQFGRDCVRPERFP